MNRFFYLLLFILLIISSNTFASETSRFALIIGANSGNADEQTLLYAGTDARRIGDVLVSIGGFLPENVVVLVDKDANNVRSTLARLNARIRNEHSQNRDSFLFVFYSGHADALSLHLGGTQLPWDEIRNVTASSSAKARLLVIDACRSGHATRVKGIKIDKPFALPPDNSDFPEGFAILSSATAGEDSQESDELKGSFFTHHFISALKGVADKNDDGMVTLSEAYRYTADRTIASTAATISGVQHPTYKYELKGKAELILSKPGYVKNMGSVLLKSAGQYFFYNQSSSGPLELEADVSQENRKVWLRPGKYFLRVRKPKRFYEGLIEVKNKISNNLNLSNLRPVEYAQFVRKGGGKQHIYSLAVWSGAFLPILDGYPTSFSQVIDFSMDIKSITFDLRASMLQNSIKQKVLKHSLSEYGLTVGGRKVFDLKRFSFSAGIRAGTAYFGQFYEGQRTAPARWMMAPILESVIRATYQIPYGFFIGFESDARIFYIKIREDASTNDELSKTPVQFAVMLGIGKFF